jgi:hypothetical protein
VVHHEGHQKGRSRGWSGLRAAVDVELHAERGNDGILRLECTKAKDMEPIDPMAFQFASVELGIFDADGQPVSSAVLNPVDWQPAPEAEAKNKPAGKHQIHAIQVLQKLEAGNEGRVLFDSWREECSKAGLNRFQFRDASTGLKEKGLLFLQEDFISSSPWPPVRERESESERGGLLYSPPHSHSRSEGEKSVRFSQSHASSQEGALQNSAPIIAINPGLSPTVVPPNSETSAGPSPAELDIW